MTPVFGHGRLRLYLLKLLDEAPRHGYEVIRLLEERFQGLYAPSAGTVYPRLAKLEQEGLITHTTEGGRKVYQLTEAGRAELATRQAELTSLEQQIRDSVTQLAGAIREDVRDTVNDLRQELWAAARNSGGTGSRRQTREDIAHFKAQVKEQARRLREDTADTRAWLHTDPSTKPVHELERLLDRFRDEIRDLARDSGVTADQLTQAQATLAAAASQLRELLH